MLPVCSAAPSCSSLSPVSFHGGTRNSYPLRNLLEDRPKIGERCFLSTRAQATNESLYYSLITEKPDQSCSTDSSIFSPYPNEFDDIVRGFSNGDFIGESGTPCLVAREINNSITEDGISISNTINPLNNQELSSISESIPTMDKDNISQSVFQFMDSVGSTLNDTEEALLNKYRELTSSIANALKSVTDSADNAVNGLFGSVDLSKKQAAGNLTGFSSSLQEKLYGAGGVAIDLLRRAIYSLEDSLGNAGSLVVDYYGSAKSLLPPNIRDSVNLSEQKVSQFLSPAGAAFQKVYIIIEGFEKNIGLDPSDPLVQLTLLLGSTTAIGVSYWVFTYSGYSGDLAPELTLDLLKNDESAILIDVRPEDLRERDGVPDLRRGARPKYTSVTFPEVDGSTKKMLKGGREIEDALIATVIRNLKIIKDDSKVIIMDVNGSRSKSIARSLKQLGVKRPYLLEGGFQSWVKQSLRVKELKSETALTVLNEEAEAILEDIKPTPTLIAGYSLAFAASIYGLLEWEKTLQLIGVLGLSLTLYQRFSSYEDSDDLKEDLSLLLTPVRLGAQAISWIGNKLEPSNIGLPTSPSTTAVHDRVLQAAAKHESQPSDSADQAPPSQANENLVSN